MNHNIFLSDFINLFSETFPARSSCRRRRSTDQQSALPCRVKSRQFFLPAGFRRGISAFVIFLLAPAFAPAATGDTQAAIDLTSRKVLVLGDSITQDGRYVSFLEYFLKRLAPTKPVDVISIGLSSETLSGLTEKTHPFPRPCALERLDRALKMVKPKIVIACYGMNDGIYHPRSPERLTAFGRGLRQFVDQIRATGARLVLVTPPVFDSLPVRARTVPNTAADFGFGAPFVDYDTVLAEFAATENALHEPDVIVIDLHSVMTAALARHREHDAAFTFSPDGVHPSPTGHLLIATTILRALDYPVPSDEPKVDLARIAADPLFDLVDARRKLRSEAWLAYVGYQRGGAFKSASVAAVELVAARLENEIDQLANK